MINYIIQYYLYNVRISKSLRAALYAILNLNRILSFYWIALLSEATGFTFWILFFLTDSDPSSSPSFHIYSFLWRTINIFIPHFIWQICFCFPFPKTDLRHLFFPDFSTASCHKLLGPTLVPLVLSVLFFKLMAFCSHIFFEVVSYFTVFNTQLIVPKPERTIMAEFSWSRLPEVGHFALSWFNHNTWMTNKLHWTHLSGVRVWICYRTLLYHLECQCRHDTADQKQATSFDRYVPLAAFAFSKMFKHSNLNFIIQKNRNFTSNSEF